MTAMAASDDAAIARTAARFDAPAPVLFMAQANPEVST